MPEQARPGPTADPDGAALLARIEALGIACPTDRLPAVLEGARHLRAAAQRLHDALPPSPPDCHS